MHERAALADLVRHACEVAAEHGAVRITQLTVRVGALSHVEPSAVAPAIEDLARGTALEGARVEVITGPQGAAALADANAGDVVLVSVEIGEP